MAALRLRLSDDLEAMRCDSEPAKQLVRINGKYEIMRIWNGQQWAALSNESRPDHAFSVGPYWVAFDLAGLAVS